MEMIPCSPDWQPIQEDYVEDPNELVSVNRRLQAILFSEARRSSVVRAFAHGAMGRWIDPSWGGPIELFLIPGSEM